MTTRYEWWTHGVCNANGNSSEAGRARALQEEPKNCILLKDENKKELWYNVESKNLRICIEQQQYVIMGKIPLVAPAFPLSGPAPSATNVLDM